MLKPCLTCGRLYRTTHQDRGRCPQHATTTARGYGTQWQALSRRILTRDDYTCQLHLPCCTGTATTVDHINPIANGGSNDETNLQAACRPCNSAKRDR